MCSNHTGVEIIFGLQKTFSSRDGARIHPFTSSLTPLLRPCLLIQSDFPFLVYSFPCRVATTFQTTPSQPQFPNEALCFPATPRSARRARRRRKLFHLGTNNQTAIVITGSSKSKSLFTFDQTQLIRPIPMVTTSG